MPKESLAKDEAYRDDAQYEGKAKRTLTRRAFLIKTMLGAAVVSLSGYAVQSGALTSALGVAQSNSSSVTESWIEPWIWRPGDWPGQQLHLNVVENENPGPVIGFGNPNAVLFNYGGSTPGPTIRMRGDEVLKVKLRNLLGEDLGETFVKEYPDVVGISAILSEEEVNQKAESLGNKRFDFCLGEHTNGVHTAHVTNLHTHGLHVRPERNPDGTHSDNVILRVLPQADFAKRQERADDPACRFLRDSDQINFLLDDEQSGEANYEFRVGNVMENQRLEINRVRAEDGLPPLPPQPHPAGTFWYHPHSHGATHNQVASGMAGFLVIEGDVDEAINRTMTGLPNPDSELKTGDYDYRERLMFIQRVFIPAQDPDAPTQTLKQGGGTPAVNGNLEPATIVMRPGAVERWRVLNGSVDGRGFKRFMVLEGKYRVVSEGGYNDLERYNNETMQWEPVSLQQVEDAKQPLWQLAWDGVTLVREDAQGNAEYFIKDLNAQNQGSKNPLTNRHTDGPRPNEAMLLNYEDIFKTGESIKDCFVRPNEVYMGPANRADLFFQAPRLTEQEQSDGIKEYTVFAKAVVVHSDNYQQDLQKRVDDTRFFPGPLDIIVAHLAVEADDSQPSIPDFDVMSLESVLPEVQPYLLPIKEDELRIENSDDFRTRIISYSGWGSQDFPLISTAASDPSAANFQAFIDNDVNENGSNLEKLIYAQSGDVNVLLPANMRTMAINGRKFDPNDPERPRMLLDTAEEWSLYNNSIMCWGNTDTEAHPQPGQYNGHYISYPISRAAGQSRFEDDNQFQIVTKGVDHPFHIHQNPFWVTRIEIPDENGDLHNILDEPRWMDVIWIPRHRGRVVFRSRFPDYVGAYVNHCHILLHEDNGMMQVVQVTPFEDQANYEAKTQVVTDSMSPDEVSQIYPRLSLEEAFSQSSSFVDPNSETGQVYPGFEVVPPEL